MHEHHKLIRSLVTEIRSLQRSNEEISKECEFLQIEINDQRKLNSRLLRQNRYEQEAFEDERRKRWKIEETLDELARASNSKNELRALQARRRLGLPSP